MGKDKKGSMRTENKKNAASTTTQTTNFPQKSSNRNRKASEELLLEEDRRSAITKYAMSNRGRNAYLLAKGKVDFFDTSAYEEPDLTTLNVDARTHKIHASMEETKETIAALQKDYREWRSAENKRISEMAKKAERREQILVRALQKAEEQFTEFQINEDETKAEMTLLQKEAEKIEADLEKAKSQTREVEKMLKEANKEITQLRRKNAVWTKYERILLAGETSKNVTRAIFGTIHPELADVLPEEKQTRPGAIEEELLNTFYKDPVNRDAKRAAKRKMGELNTEIAPKNISDWTSFDLRIRARRNAIAHPVIDTEIDTIFPGYPTKPLRNLRDLAREDEEVVLGNVLQFMFKNMS